MVHSKLVCKEIAMTVETGVGNFFFDFPSISVDHWNEGCFAFWTCISGPQLLHLLLCWWFAC